MRVRVCRRNNWWVTSSDLSHPRRRPSTNSVAVCFLCVSCSSSLISPHAPSARTHVYKGGRMVLSRSFCRSFCLATKRHKKHTKENRLGGASFLSKCLCRLCAFLWLFSVVTGAVADFEFLFAQIGIRDLDRDLSIRAVAFLIG